jgi:D-serine deaminase-like pyridoxal phosphate-dependent protein
VRVTFEAEVLAVNKSASGNVALDNGMTLWAGQKGLIYIEAIERPLQVGERVMRSPAMSDATCNGFGAILAVSGDEAWVKWEDSKFTPIQRLNWLRRA